MTKRSVLIQVLTIVPSLPSAPCWMTSRRWAPAGRGNETCFLVRLKRAVSSSRPAPERAPRAAAVKHGRRPPPQAARSVLDGREHGARLREAGTGWFMR